LLKAELGEHELNADGEQLPEIAGYTPSGADLPVSPPPAPAAIPPPPTVPAGWYPDPDNHTGFRYGGAPSARYFDGVQWTENRVPMPRRQQQPPPQPQPQAVFVNQQFAPPAPPVVVYNNGTSHGLHLILTIVTCGLWLPVWIIMTIVNSSR
jgi:hypothetical protein